MASLYPKGHCYMVNIYIWLQKRIFFSFSHKSMGAINPQDVTRQFDPRGLIGGINVGHHLTLLHVLNIKAVDVMVSKMFSHNKSKGALCCRHP